MTQVTNKEFAVNNSALGDGQPTISVLMPLHAWHPHVTDAVNSLLEQTHQAMEILVIGIDDTARLLNRLPSDDRLRVISRTAPGIVGALNTGLQHATGDYIARMDSDDICHPSRFTRQLRHLQKETASATLNRSDAAGDLSATAPPHILCGTRIEFIDEQGKSTQVGAGNRRYEAWLNSVDTAADIEQNLFVECPLPHPTWLAHRDLWKRVGGYRDCHWAEDYDFLLRAWLAGVSFTKPPEALLQWRVHAHRLTVTDARYSRDAFIRAKAWALVQAGLHLAHTDRSTQRGVWICGVGRNAKLWFDALHELGVRVDGFVDLDRPARRQTLRDRPVTGYSELLATPRSSLIVSALSQPEARAAVLAEFDARGLHYLTDYILGG